MSRASPLECHANGFAGRALREIENVYGEMFGGDGGICCGAQGSSKTLYRILYKGSRKRLPSLPTKVIKGAYRDCC